MLGFFLLLAHVPHPLRHSSSCASTNDEVEVLCLLTKDPSVRIVIPVVARVDNDACACTTYESCTSNGVIVNPRCGCEDFLKEGRPFCYVQGACPIAVPSPYFNNALYIFCDGPPPPPPASHACTDPLFPEQWHHLRISSNAAWHVTRGEGSTIVIVDDGVQYSHPDLRVVTNKSFGWEFSTASRVETADDDFSRHGTCSAGVATAVHDNYVGGCGIASGASLAAVKLLKNYMQSSNDYYFSDDLFISTLQSFHLHEQTILSNSWGPTDDRRVEGPGIQTSYSRLDDAIYEFGRLGRGEKGGVLVFAAGNGGRYDNSNDDGFTSHPYTFAVGAIGDNGRRTGYSEPGACIDLVAPSNGGWRAVTTTDLTGIVGYSKTNHTDVFGGTSASAPMVSAVLALIMSIRPELTLRDLKRILHTTTTVNDPQDAHWVRNGDGRWFNPWYGFGLVNAAAAVEAARGWDVLPSHHELCSELWSGYLPFTSERVTILFGSLETTMSYVDEVRVYVSIQHEHRGDVSIAVVSPEQTRSVLTFVVPSSFAMHTNAFVPHWYLTHAFEGEHGARNGWSLEINDVSRSGRLVEARICVKGDLSTPPSLPISPPLSFVQPPPPQTNNSNVVRVVLFGNVGFLFVVLVIVCVMVLSRRRTKLNKKSTKLNEQNGSVHK